MMTIGTDLGPISTQEEMNGHIFPLLAKDRITTVMLTHMCQAIGCYCEHKPTAACLVSLALKKELACHFAVTK